MPFLRRVLPTSCLNSVLLVACLAMSRPAWAQQPAASDPVQTDVREWIQRKWQGDAPAAATPTPRRTSFFLAPVITSKPSTGVAFGVGGSLEFPLGDPADTYVSSILPSASFSTKKQYSVAGRLAVFGPRNQWAVTGDNHVRETGQEVYGGSGDAATTALDVSFTSFKVMDSYLRRMPRGLFAGVGFLYQRQRDVAPLDSTADWAQSPYVEYSEQFGFDLSGQTSAGLAWVLRRDGRDNVSDPSHGWFLETAFRTYFEGFLGGASTWQSVALDARGYIRPIAGRRHTLAAWTYVDVITGGRAPYFALPATGTDPMGRSGRGYAEGRFRGDRLVYSELEYRLPLRADGLVGMVGFLNASAVGSTFDDEPLFDRAAIGGGFGFRLRLDKRSRTNLCLDFGFGQNGSRGVYLALAEAF